MQDTKQKLIFAIPSTYASSKSENYVNKKKIESAKLRLFMQLSFGKHFKGEGSSSKKAPFPND